MSVRPTLLSQVEIERVAFASNGWSLHKELQNVGTFYLLMIWKEQPKSCMRQVATGCSVNTVDMIQVNKVLTAGSHTILVSLPLPCHDIHHQPYDQYHYRADDDLYWRWGLMPALNNGAQVVLRWLSTWSSPLMESHEERERGVWRGVKGGGMGGGFIHNRTWGSLWIKIVGKASSYSTQFDQGSRCFELRMWEKKKTWLEQNRRLGTKPPVILMPQPKSSPALPNPWADLKVVACVDK